MAGTAAFNPTLPASAIVTSDLTGEELWAMTTLGYAPIKLLMSTSIYSLGLTGGFLAAFKSFSRGSGAGACRSTCTPTCSPRVQ
jgi:hypothetical protein